MKTLKALPMNGPSGRKPQARGAGFTLIELLVVIAIIGVLAGMTMLVTGVVKRNQLISTATAELHGISNALEQYKAKYGVYPPSNGNNYAPLTNSLFPTLYYELTGVTLSSDGKTYTTLDGKATFASADYSTAYGVAGIMNCTKGNAEESMPARNFLSGLRAGQLASVQNPKDPSNSYTNLVTSARPGTGIAPFGVDVAPFRYLCPGVNNPNSYDLYVQLVISGKTNLICNWTTQVIINSPLQ